MIEREDGTLVLPTNHDPAHERVLGYKRYWLGVDLGQNDPTGLVLIQDERIPFWEGNKQKLGERRRAIVWADYLTDTSYAAILSYIQQLMTRPAIKGRVKLAIDATGLGRPFSDFLTDHQMSHVAVQITAGAATSRKGRLHNVSKVLLLGDLANALETHHLQIAHDLPLNDRLQQELESLEVKTTSAGNQVLDASRSEGTGHADLAVATAIALYHSNVGAGFIGEDQLAGYW